MWRQRAHAVRLGRRTDGWKANTRGILHFYTNRAHWHLVQRDVLGRLTAVGGEPPVSLLMHPCGAGCCRWHSVGASGVRMHDYAGHPGIRRWRTVVKHLGVCHRPLAFAECRMRCSPPPPFPAVAPVFVTALPVTFALPRPTCAPRGFLWCHKT